MFSDISWGQFLSYALPALVLYAVVVLYLYYRKDVSKTITSRRLVGKTTASDPPTSGTTSSDRLRSGRGGVMGKTREQRSASTSAETSAGEATPAPLVCDACGHVHGTPSAVQTASTRTRQIDSYGIPIPDAPPLTVAKPSTSASVIAPPVTVHDEFESVDGLVDIAAMARAIATVETITSTAAAGRLDTDEAASRKAAAVSLFANEDLLNSEFASQLALQLDTTAPTAGYSAVATLETLKAA